MTDLAWLTVAEGAALLRAKKLSPVEWTKALLDRIAALDEHYHAFIAVTADTARAEAKAAEAEIAEGQYRGPMHGMPYAAKDIFDVAGLATTCHSKLRMDHRAAADAIVVTRLRDAGAVLLGKLALHEFATGGPTLELPWPAARNPWNLDLHPGGSSSGSGAALATGLAPATLGTDTGGSVRNPATCCGVIGMKPTYGAVSRAGVFPLTFSLDHVGPLTRTVEDNAILLHAIAGHDPADPASARTRTGRLLDGPQGRREGAAHRRHRAFLQGGHGRPCPSRSPPSSRPSTCCAGSAPSVKPIRLSPLPLWTDCGRTIHTRRPMRSTRATCSSGRRTTPRLTRSRLLPGAFIPAANTSRRSSCAPCCAARSRRR